MLRGENWSGQIDKMRRACTCLLLCFVDGHYTSDGHGNGSKLRSAANARSTLVTGRNSKLAEGVDSSHDTRASFVSCSLSRASIDASVDPSWRHCYSESLHAGLIATWQDCAGCRLVRLGILCSCGTISSNPRSQRRNGASPAVLLPP